MGGERINADLMEGTIANQQETISNEIQRDFYENAVDSPSSAVKRSTPIFQLHLDCFEEWFEWLSLTDLLTLRLTCKRFKEAVDFYIALHYPAVKMQCRKLVISDENISQFQQLDLNLAKLKEQTESHFSTSELCADAMEIPQSISQIEMIEFDCFQIDSEYLRNLLKFYPKLKRLSIRKIYGSILTKNGNKWLLHQYPQLEHIVLDDWWSEGHFGKQIDELKSFFDVNPNVRILSISLHLFWVNRDWLKECSTKFDELHLQGYCLSSEFDQICVLINELHERGFYKRLHFYGMFVSKAEVLERIFALRALDKLYLGEVSVPFDLPPSFAVQELSFHFDSDIVDLNRLANNLLSIKRISFRYAEFDTISTFIRRSPRLKEIVIHHLVKKDGTHFKDGVIDVAELGKERRKLAKVGKITIYLNENTLLRTKWAKTIIKCPLVEIKRHAAERNRAFCPCLW